TEASKKDYQKWLKTSNYKPVINIENHDTISTLAIDKEGLIAGACTTSGAAWKMHGRVGDSPIIGAGLFVDQEVGGACATGLGEEMMRTAGSAMVVEMMRNGKSPQEACENIVDRIVKRHKSPKDIQVGFMAIDINGQIGAYSVQRGFTYAVKDNSTDELLEAKYQID
ncbi:MAG: isoaspartyl peptidase/L-asparaginase, partial [Bacteroidota bacterium]